MTGSIASTSQRAIQQLDNSLVTHPSFANHKDILDRALSFGRGGIALLGRTSRPAAEIETLLDGLKPEELANVLQDPVLRRLTSAALRDHRSNDTKFDPNAFENLAAEINIGERAESAPIRGRHTQLLGTGFARSIVWTDHLLDGWWGQQFQNTFRVEIGSSVSSNAVVLRSPATEMVQALDDGHRLLMDTVPALALSNLAHVKIVAVIDFQDTEARKGRTRPDLCQNVSTHSIPATIFLSPSPLRSPWYAAEALLHEAAHKKLSDIVLTRSIFAEGYSLSEAPVVTAIWNRSLSWNPNNWTIDRALFALHVYLHLVVLFDAFCQQKPQLEQKYGPMGDLNAEKLRQGAIDRSVYLAKEIRTVGWDALGQDGRELVDWMCELTNLIAPLASKNLYIGLLLDRYDRETRELGNLIRSVSDRELDYLNTDSGINDLSIREAVGHLIHSEIVATYRVFSTMGEQTAPAFSFYDGDRWAKQIIFRNASASQLADWFQSTRSLTSAGLRSSTKGIENLECRTRQTKTLLDIVDDLVTHAERHRSDLQRLITFARPQSSPKMPSPVVADSTVG